MANYRRRRPKQHSVTTCGAKRCRYDMGRMQTNGFYRYPIMFWKKLEGPRAWRYTHKNVDPTSPTNEY